MRRAAWKTRSAASAATTWCRSRRSLAWRSSTSLLRRRAFRIWTARSPGVPRRSAQARRRRSTVLRPLPADRSDAGSRARRAWTQKSMIDGPPNHYSFPVRLVGLQVARPGGAREIVVPARRAAGRPQPRLRGSQLGPPSWITTSSCWHASPVRWRTRSRCARSASAAVGRPASTSCGAGSRWEEERLRPGRSVGAEARDRLGATAAAVQDTYCRLDRRPCVLRLIR